MLFCLYRDLLMKKILLFMETYSLPLIGGILAALLWANLDYFSYSAFVHYKFFGGVDSHFIVNEVFLVLFFGLISIEIVHEFSPQGNLHPLDKALTNILAALGGVIFPIVLFGLLNFGLGEERFSAGWAIATATDVAVALLFARFVFPKGHPAFVFLLFLAVVDDFIGLGIIALFYPSPDQPLVPWFLLLVLLAMGMSYVLRRRGGSSFYPYMLPAVVSWVGMFGAGLHPALALVWIVPFMRDGKSHSLPLHKLEHFLTPIVTWGLFFFGLVNAGVVINNLSTLSLIIFLSLCLGKTLGIFGFTKVAYALRLTRGRKLCNRDLLLIGLVASVGLTVSLFIADIAYTDEALKDAAKMGALLSLLCGALAVGVAKIWKPKK